MARNRVGIDFHVARGIPQGVKTYLANLIGEMLDIESSLQFNIYTSSASDHPAWHRRHVVLKGLPSRSGYFNLVAGFGAVARRDGLDLFHSQYVLPLFLPCRSVLTVHDILFESHPEFFPEVHRRLLKVFVPLSARRATRVIAVSEFTRQQLVRFYGLAPHRIRVIHEAGSQRFGPIGDREWLSGALAKYGIHKPYVLFVGRIEPRKNIVGLLEAYQYVRQRGLDVSLVIVGSQDRIFKGRELFRRQEQAAFGQDIIFTGPVNEEHLALLYNGAQVLAYPAFAEGFGLPVIEAMACGTPVITSNTTSLPEVAGEAALLVDPYSPVEIGRALERVLSDPALRENLSTRGLERASQFSWRAAAEQTLEVYREALGG